MTIDELKKELEMSIEHQLFLIGRSGRWSAEGQEAAKRAEVLQAVLQRIEGDRIALNCYK